MMMHPLSLLPLTCWTVLGYRGSRGDEWRYAWTGAVQDPHSEW